ncbi:OmpA family protein [Caballeronia sp. LZ016]|uniref:OmpA family protein n=1 Tax=Caballeronia sp. LZ016 TaxID=3038554 RepID=UPI00285F3567|nr:OmpA family protein [Caballeronia sp. LZ016]MDR5740932.1 hypothetical protein [Caballeronia sp. LZ016]
MMSFLKALSLFYAGIVLATQPLYACTISESFQQTTPLNVVDMGNAARLRLVDTVLRARRWPVSEIIASVSTPALGTERRPSVLSSARAEAVKRILLQLGLKESNIFVESPVYKKPVAPNKEALDELRSIAVDFYPKCDDDCARLCDDPRVLPDSRIVR